MRRPIDEFYKYKFFKAVFYSSRERVAQLADYLIPKYEDRFGFTRSADVLLEIMPQGVTKARQLKFLKERFSKQYQNVELWCAGDFDNDTDMLKYADFAACPENATDSIKKICQYHLCHCSEGAVGELIDIIEEKQNKK